MIGGIDTVTGAFLTHRRAGVEGPTGGAHIAVGNGALVTSYPKLSLVSFDRP